MLKYFTLPLFLLVGSVQAMDIDIDIDENWESICDGQSAEIQIRKLPENKMYGLDPRLIICVLYHRPNLSGVRTQTKDVLLTTTDAFNTFIDQREDGQKFLGRVMDISHIYEDDTESFTVDVSGGRDFVVNLYELQFREDASFLIHGVDQESVPLGYFNEGSVSIPLAYEGMGRENLPVPCISSYKKISIDSSLNETRSDIVKEFHVQILDGRSYLVGPFD